MFEKELPWRFAEVYLRSHLAACFLPQRRAALGVSYACVALSQSEAQWWCLAARGTSQASVASRQSATCFFFFPCSFLHFLLQRLFFGQASTSTTSWNCSSRGRGGLLVPVLSRRMGAMSGLAGEFSERGAARRDVKPKNAQGFPWVEAMLKRRLCVWFSLVCFSTWGSTRVGFSLRKLQGCFKDGLPCFAKPT